MKRLPLLLLLFSLVLYGCNDSSSITSSEVEDTTETPSTNKFKAGEDIIVSELRFEKESSIVNELGESPTYEENPPPLEMPDDIKALRDVEKNSAGKTGWYFYDPDNWDPWDCSCYWYGYWPGNISDIQVTVDNYWNTYGYNWLTYLGYGSNSFNLNGVATAFQTYGYYGPMNINGWDENGQFVEGHYLGGSVWPGYRTVYFSSPVKYIQLWTTSGRYMDWFQVHYVEPNRPPVADAGADDSVVAGNAATLDGSGSSDPDGDALTFEWKEGATVIGNTASVGVGPYGAVGTHTYTLTVTDPSGASDTDDVTITVTNTDPIADAGPDQTVYAGSLVSLDGSGSSDPDGHSLTYSWSNGATTAGTVVGPHNVGSITYSLTVDDGYGGSTYDYVKLTVVAIPVSFDIKPDDNNNKVNSKSKGVIPTAILGSADFDVNDIDVSTLAFGPGGAGESHGKGHVEDVNGDGFDDLVLHFGTQESGLSKGDTSATVTGLTTDGWEFEGSDSVSVK